MDAVTKVTWRSSAWTVVIGAPLVCVILLVVGLPWVTKRSYEKAARRACQANLQVITQAKAAWAKAENKQSAEIPRDEDLFGAGKSIPRKPVCQWKGSYSLGALAQKPVCSQPGHTI